MGVLEKSPRRCTEGLFIAHGNDVIKLWTVTNRKRLLSCALCTVMFDWVQNFVSIFLDAIAPHCAMASSFTRFLDHTQRRTTVGGTPLEGWSASRRGLNLTTHNTCNRQKSMLPMGFERTVSADQRPQTDALDRAATGTGGYKNWNWKL